MKDKHGNIIDGFHRVGENADWYCITVETVDTPVKLALARLAVNYCRRKVHPEELTERITFLVKAGMKPEEIAQATGISVATIYRYIPQELKDQKLSESQKEGWVEKSFSHEKLLGIKENSDAHLQQTVTTYDGATITPSVTPQTPTPIEEKTQPLPKAEVKPQKIEPVIGNTIIRIPRNSVECPYCHLRFLLKAED